MVSTTFAPALVAVLLAVPLTVWADAPSSQPEMDKNLTIMPLSQPVAPVKPVTDTYFGTKVVDNYRWMEDLNSPELVAWWHAQAAYTKDYLAKLPGRHHQLVVLGRRL